LRSDDLVFPSPKHGGYMSDSYPRNALYDALSNAGLGHLRDKAHKPRPFRFHDLRHTFGAYAAQAGVDLEVIAAAMGHTSTTVTKLYAHLSPRYKRNELMKMATVVTRMQQRSRKHANRKGA